MLSAVVRAFPASYPNKTLLFASVPEKLAPALVPAIKLFCASGLNPPAEIPVSAEPSPTKLVAVTTPAAPILILLPTSN